MIWLMNYRPIPSYLLMILPCFLWYIIEIKSTSQKHLGIILDNCLSFEEYVFSKINRAIGLLRKLQCLIPRSARLTIYKTFARPHLDYGDIIYEKVYNSSFHQKIESVQYNACLAITVKNSYLNNSYLP